MDKRRLYSSEHDALLKLRVAENILRHTKEQGLPSDIPDRSDGGCKFHGIV